MSETRSTAVLDRPATTPPAYGYMRVPCDVSDEKVRKLENQVVAFAENNGLRFVGFFFEFHCGSREAFDELVAELVRTDAHHVVVPSLRHLAQNGLLQDQMLEHLSFKARAQVLAMRLRTAIE
ncbi:hypothetical protein NQK81_14255 [Amycolatopsis roodepoortensis]|uniref:recombinase family protein n=1 Tax=Amycolatopsis roodepoortensis TaxID=700274 RepID=UPI00214A9AA8|nr:hypothetical protein [Amycolatopsis roodepoortensis]UUV34556.1 hypothetical protein NQK81_14255 [Amycolatopsis roodepoortensis]